MQQAQGLPLLCLFVCLPSAPLHAVHMHCSSGRVQPPLPLGPRLGCQDDLAAAAPRLQAGVQRGRESEGLPFTGGNACPSQGTHLGASQRECAHSERPARINPCTHLHPAANVLLGPAAGQQGHENPGSGRQQEREAWPRWAHARGQTAGSKRASQTKGRQTCRMSRAAAAQGTAQLQSGKGIQQ